MYTYSFLQNIVIALNYSGALLLQMLPYVVGGILLGEALKLPSWTKAVYSGISGKPAVSAVAASFLGAASPLCTYGTVPVVLQLFRSGVHLAPLVAFLSVSAMMNPQLFIYTWGWLGPEMALLRLGLTLLFGLLLGLCLYRVPVSRIVRKSALGIDSAEDILNRQGRRFEWRKFLLDALKSAEYVGFYMVLGVLISAFFEVFVPHAWLTGLLSGNKVTSTLSSVLLGVPLYACGGGVLPVIKQLMSEGLGRGPALAFFLVGPATRVMPIMALATVLKPVYIALYLVAVIAFAFFAGILL